MEQTRLTRLREALADAGLEAVLVADPKNRAYLSGFTGSSGYLLITMDRAFLLTDFRYVEQAGAEAPGFNVVRHGSQVFDTLRELATDSRVTRLGYEQSYLTCEQFAVLGERLNGMQLIPIKGMTERLRQVKNDEEIRRIREAVRLADEAFRHIRSFIRQGVRETEVAAELEYVMRKAGAEGSSFETIVASGPRAALPHGVASARRLAPGDLVVMDFGAVYQGYCSDITRTVVVGEPSIEQRQVYDLVLRAQSAAIAAIKPGITGAQADAAARDVIAGAGHSEHFGHGLGHGVGLAVHEEPRLSPGVDLVLEPGMVVTVEPGVYISGWGGVRIEDMVVVRPGGCEVLTGAPKNLATF